MSKELTPAEDERGEIVLPSRNHAVVLVSNMQLRCGRCPTLGRPGPDVLEALTVNVDDVETRKLTLSWGEQRRLGSAEGGVIAVP